MSELILDLDVGNSYTKWRVSTKSGRLKNEDIGQLEKLIVSRLSRIRIACVAANTCKVELVDTLRLKFNCEPEFARPTIACAGMCNGYKYPEMLGVDRWLAGLAVWAQSNSNPCLVVDAGSALTIDTIDDKGVFLGGYIIPGLVMMQQSLINNAAEIICDIEYSIPEGFLGIPSDTAEAVQWGAGFAISAIVEKAVEVFLRCWPHGTVRITGGNGADLAEKLGMIDKYKPDLVLDGLALALP